MEMLTYLVISEARIYIQEITQSLHTALLQGINKNIENVLYNFSLTIPGTLHFHMNFRISLWITTDKKEC